MGAGAIGADRRVQVHREVRLLPAVFLQRPPQLLVRPDELQHLAGPSHLALGTLSATKMRTSALSSDCLDTSALSEV